MNWERYELVNLPSFHDSKMYFRQNGTVKVIPHEHTAHLTCKYKKLVSTTQYTKL